jgi:hypothetical protein
MAGRSSREITDTATVAIGDVACPGAAARLALPQASGAREIGLPSNRRCFSRRRLTVRLRDPRGRERLRSVVVRINGRPRATYRGRRLRTSLRRFGGVRVDLLGQRGRVRVNVIARTTRGRTLRRKRSYLTCAPRRVARGPRG